MSVICDNKNDAFFSGEIKKIPEKIGCVDFIKRDNELFGRVGGNGVDVEYRIKNVNLKTPVEAVLMDLDGTTVTSEEFWVYIIERTMARLTGNESFAFTEADIPFVSGFSTADHLRYAIDKYAAGADLREALKIYHGISEEELAKIMRGEGRTDAFKPTAGLKEFLLELKRRNIKIGLVTSGLDYKAIPEITSVFRTIGLGDPLKFYDCIMMGGRRKDVGEYGTIGELAAKPHPWVYTETAYNGLKISDPARVVGIEDSAAGALALRFAGFSVIGLESGNITSSGANWLCHKKVNTFSEILDII